MYETYEGFNRPKGPKVKVYEVNDKVEYVKEGPLQLHKGVVIEEYGQTCLVQFDGEEGGPRICHSNELTLVKG